MIENCLGSEFSILLRFYQEMNEYIKEITKNSLKCALSNGLCKGRVDECLEYLQVINDLIEMDYDMGESVQYTRPSMKRRFGGVIFDRLINITEKYLDQYNLINQLLRDEKMFMEQFVHHQYKKYETKHIIAQQDELADQAYDNYGEPEDQNVSEDPSFEQVNDLESVYDQNRQDNEELADDQVNAAESPMYDS